VIIIITQTKLYPNDLQFLFVQNVQGHDDSGIEPHSSIYLPIMSNPCWGPRHKYM